MAKAGNIKMQTHTTQKGGSITLIKGLCYEPSLQASQQDECHLDFRRNLIPENRHFTREGIVNESKQIILLLVMKMAPIDSLCFIFITTYPED